MYLNNFQSYIFGAVLLFVMGFVACEKSISDLPALELGKTSILKTNQSVNFKSTANDNLKLTVVALIDKFCPKGTTCVVAGYAEAKLTIINQNNQNVAFSLFFGDYYGNPKKLGFKPDTLDFNLHQKAYRAILKSIKSGDNDDQLQAEIVLLEK
ncbi:hypothetical protein [Pedobacter cryophilus]|uniref:Uncharacterized protein n=1 Tax=Pedobacter cryophilus TaxID=2571271 RepID=A0A4U1C162_9SPHI|nr:hypothetical protein [Pedobacter cryophilus]TKB98697.1 hypothetical protein FA046_06160 [Pedobacter cryophilus]